MRKILVIEFILMFICLSCIPAYGGRPLSTEDAGVAGKGALETESGVEFTRYKNKDIDYAFSLVPIYGFTENLEFSVEAFYNLIRPDEGINQEGLVDIVLNLKTLVLEEKEKTPSFLLKTTLKLANGNENKNLGSGDKDIGFILVASKTIEPAIIHANLGYTFVGDKSDATLDDFVLYGIAAEYAVSSKLSFVSEIYGESNSHFDIGSFKHHTINPLFGFTYQVTEKVIFDTAFKIGIRAQHREAYGVMTGLSMAF